VAPSRVSFSFAAPRRYRHFTEALGVSRVDFGCPFTSFTFKARDLRLPMTGADPRLARILADYAGLLPAPAPATWLGELRLDTMLAAGPSNPIVAVAFAAAPLPIDGQFGLVGPWPPS
jgi:hypothetical protein